ncbi:PSD1 and planctomycete cytochrome C domain-containing protein [Stieleria sp. JC731]|uniref:PSD1 and planctomycete cytochrome C domain-containing protein n=1 Tax=Pirellulaceae TaxID=2691357 RepID=UPI001E647D36|nr:PSD1 and planctomycete cytochrome C domain-containing protein [Stieleria sp. JC731]MCC9603843.1 PSD1 and planctomycete cytochrome C domain-containing protein [Stieleria sp. JC731]
MLPPSPMNMTGCLAGLCWLLAAFVVCSAAHADSQDADFFESRIRPVLIEHCYECHSDQSDIVQGGLRLDFSDTTRQGGDSGVAVVPGDPDASLLLRAMKYEESEMPPAGKLDDRILHDFETWIRNGAADPRNAATTVDAPEHSDSSAIDWNEERDFWSFKPPVGTPKSIDELIKQKLEPAGLRRNPKASRRALIRRLSFDLRGLPPSDSEVQQFVSNKHPAAIERMIDKYLADPSFGEHWARLWLDVARYAEDQAHKVGDNDSLTYPNAYLYRNWVIDAFAQDIPYDEFIRLQLAADHYQPESKEQHLALGFLGLGPKYYARNSPEVMADEWEDRVDTVTRGLLGLTVACARCHDHKYDPIPTSDYYALAGVFASTEMFNRPIDDQVKTKNGQSEKPQDGVHIVRDGKPQDLHVMIRGDAKRKGDLAPRHFLTVLSPAQPEPLTDNSGRANLAEAIVAPENPLTARVIVNRIWRQLMGRGLVETPSNFGKLGQRPSHPELLDTLAHRLVQNQWSLKRLIREIVVSETYQQSSQSNDDAMRLDADNRLYWRMSPKRLRIEAYRDAVLYVSGTLDQTVGGRSIDPESADESRKTVYSEISRMDLNSLLARFGFPDPNAHCAKRAEVTTPLQKLFLLNSPFIVKQAEKLAEHAASSDHSTEDQIVALYRQLLSRPPTSEEIELSSEFLCGDAASKAAWVQFAQMLLISNEMQFIE